MPYESTSSHAPTFLVDPWVRDGQPARTAVDKLELVSLLAGPITSPDAGPIRHVRIPPRSTDNWQKDWLGNVLTHVSLIRTRSASYWANFARLSALSRLPPDWNGYGSARPAPNAIDAAKEVLLALDNKGFEADDVVASAEGGVGICFVRGDRYATIECDNDGDIVLGLSDGQNPVARELDGNDLEEAVEEVRAFLQ